MSELKRELLAHLVHEQWSGWMKYLFSKGELNEKGEYVIPQWAVERWTRQLNTHYLDLSETEKEGNRIEADKILNLFER